MADVNELTRLVRTKIHICGCGCWVWMGSVDSSGYAKIKMRQKTLVLHIYVYNFFHGDHRVEGEDMTIDHLCDRHRNCLNPDHMEPVTRGENSKRANYRRWHAPEPDRSACTPPTPREKHDEQE